MALENTASVQSTSTVPAAPTTGTKIEALPFLQMIQILEDLTSHTHTVYDDYTSVCECACNRGIL